MTTRAFTGAVRRRAFSQQALRRRDEAVRSAASASTSARTSTPRSPSVQHALDGRSYLLPTMTLQRVAGSNAIATVTASDGPLLQTRARKTPIVLDLQLVSSDGSPHAQPIKKHELRAEIERLNELGFVPVGITNASEDIKQVAAKLQLPYFISTRLHAAAAAAPVELESTETQTEAAPEEDPTTESTAVSTATNTTTNAEDSAAAPPAAAPEKEPPMIVYAGVRSGQQVYAQNRSLVVLGNVNSGAEVLADDDVVVVGALKGRALAGIGGNVNARIVCQSFDAELVSIAHHFTTCDDLQATQQSHTELRPHKPTTISLRDDQLHFQSVP
ncbi:hypothetical protein Poli38472_011001 [Pythium oligandrum]|uniref:Septum formation inhibitor MinC C-terminal domain-containing protein n=1 Tax=Pythium oligandrum TaxID=41045 RepID=A0A8K1CF85_PYTOL|nr:hypothetical protein Poli38472_011001 [Pythium oligandrum]|eukprot:TMW61938.1 hypothetical protein Poli38472_011001 [Pythium oligandrum]